MFIYGDVETSTRLPGEDPLDEYGGYRYASDPSTRLNSAATAAMHEKPFVFEYGQEAAFKRYLLAVLKETDWKFVFHYALFELSIIRCVLGVEIPPDRVIDTYLMLGFYGYPRGLDKGAQALGCSTLKDLVGKDAMKELSTGLWTPREKPFEFHQLYAYNAVDVEVTREIHQKLPPLPPEVQALWEIDTEINMHGIPIDLAGIQNAIAIRDYLKNEADLDMARMTEGLVTTVGQRDRIIDFARRHGVEMVDCTADTVRRTLDTQIPPIVRDVLTLRQDANLSSLAKFDQAMKRQVNGRLYHEFDPYGCGTGRPKGKGFQALNLARSAEADFLAETLSKAPECFIAMHDKPSKKLKESMRGHIKAEPGHILLGGDLGQIEARCTGWSAGDEKFVNLFHTSDPYCTYGEKLWGHPLVKADMDPYEFLIKRTAAKANVLSNGFAGGIGAVQRGAESYNYSLDVVASIVLPGATPHEIEAGRYSYEKYYLPKKPKKPLTEEQGIAADILKQRYRADFAKITAYWDELWQTFLNGGQAGPVYVEKKDRLRILYLPSGRPLYYHDVRYHKQKKVLVTFDEEGNLECAEEDESDEYWTYQARERRKRLWKGVVIENVAQGENHDISTWYMRKAHRNIARVIHECYDEFTMMVEIKRLEWARAEFEKLVTTTQPDWTMKGPMVLPIAFDIWSGERYG